MLTPMELRGQSRIYQEESANETMPEIKRRLANHALALALLAEKIEREEAEREAS
jgi:hypothetical protein